MAIIAHQDIAIHSVEDIMLAVGIIFAVVFWTEAKTKKFIVDFLLSGEADHSDKRLFQYSTNLAVTVLCKAKHTIGTIWKILVVCLDAFKERGQVIV